MKTCILTVIKNEQEYLDEWIKYHLDLGIDHIFMFEDIDSDSHKEICDKYGDKVSLNSISIVLDDENKKITAELKQTKTTNPQWIYFKSSLLYLQSLNEYDWCFVIDVDEYITFENEKENIEDILNMFSQYDAIVIQWKCYGANGFIKKPDYTNKGIVETYTSEMAGHIPLKRPFITKVCYNLKTYKDTNFGHIHQSSDNCKWCKTDFTKNRETIVYKSIYLRHYITKSWEEYVWKIKTRGYFWGKTRNIDFFFSINSDMADKKEQLINELKNEKLVVLPYKQSGSQGNEIRLALNAWKKFCNFNYHFVVIGEFDDNIKKDFPWVEFIYIPQNTKIDGQFSQHINVQNCMEIIMKKYDKVYDGFIWMVDDNYAIKPFYFEDIKKIHNHSESFVGNEKSPTHFWNHDKWKTRQLLDKENLPHINYTTHYPCYFDFNKLKEIWDKFNMRNESYVLEDVYFNYFPHEKPVLDSTIRFGIWNKSIFKNDFQKAVDNPNIKFVCNSVEGWSRELEDELWKIVRNSD